MKTKRFCSLFLLLTLCLSLLVPAGALSVDEMEVAAVSAILVEGETGEVLFEQNSTARRAPASLTKVMTAMLVIEKIDRGELGAEQTITVSPTAREGLAADGSTQNIKAGEEMSLKDLLYCTLVASANEACNILAETVSGSVDSFVALMNQRAAELGMEGTHYANPHGLHDPDHYTTAYDLWLLAREAMTHPLFRQIVATVDYYVPPTNLSEQRHFYNTNALLTSWRYLGYTYRSAIGIKTGHTDAAGQCLLSAAQEDGRTLYCVVLGAENVEQKDGSLLRNSFAESKRLLQWGFSNFERRAILSTTDLQGEVAVTLSKIDRVVAAPAGTLEATLPNDLAIEDFTVTPTYIAESVQAPVEKGQVLGTVTVSYNGKAYGTMDLVALNAVERDEWMYRIHCVKTFLSQLWVKIALGVILVLVVILVIHHTLNGRRRRRYGARQDSYRGRR